MDQVGGIHADDVAFVRVLGPLQVVTASGCAVDLPSVSQRRLLARLATDDDQIGTLERALALWTGPPFEEFSAEDWAGPEATRLAELHASAIEDHAAELIGARRWP